MFMLDEGVALAKLYETCGGASWNLSVGWLNGNAPCATAPRWHGVRCSPNTSRVVGLTLNHNHLVGSLPTQLGLLPQLAEVALHGIHGNGCRCGHPPEQDDGPERRESRAAGPVSTRRGCSRG